MVDRGSAGRQALSQMGNLVFRAGVKQIVLESNCRTPKQKFCAVLVEVYHAGSQRIGTLRGGCHLRRTTPSWRCLVRNSTGGYRTFLSHIRDLIDWDISWVNDRVAGGDKLREEWREKCKQHSSTQAPPESVA